MPRSAQTAVAEAVTGSVAGGGHGTGGIAALREQLCFDYSVACTGAKSGAATTSSSRAWPGGMGSTSRPAASMFKPLLMSLVIVPVLLGMQVATRRRGRNGLVILIALVITFGVLYILMLYYLRLRWVG
jgi:hypothetical protein